VGIILAGAMAVVPAQTPNSVLEIKTSPTGRGGSGSFLITLKPRTGMAVVALQWELTAGPGIAIESRDIIAGSAAESSEKSITCVAKQPKFVCILAGGQKSLHEGTIAIVRYKIGAQAHGGAPIVRDLKKIEIGSAQATIPVE
jgi:hypothetical protein